MKKNISAIIAIMMFSAGIPSFADTENINTYPVKEKTLHSVIFEKGTVPTLDDMTDAVMNSAKSGNQTNSASNISEILDKGTGNVALVEGSVSSGRIIGLDDCIKTALANHPSIESYRMNAAAYKTKIGQAWSAYFPTLGIQAQYSRNDALETTAKIPKPRYDLFYMPSLSANLLIFDFGKTKALANVAKKYYQAAEDSVQMSINDVIFDVKDAYYNLLFALEAQKVYTDNVKDLEMHLEQAKAFYLIGTKPKIDVLTAEYELGKAKLNLIKADNNIKLAYAKLNDAMGLPENSEYETKDNLVTEDYDVTFEDMIDIAYNTRPEYLAAQKKKEASELSVRASRRAFMPDITAFGAFTQGGGEINRDIGYQFGGGISYSGFNAMLLKKQLDEAKALAKKDEADFKLVKQQVYLEVKNAYVNFVNSKDSIPVAALAMIQAKEQYDLAEGRYKVGLGDAIELKDAETTYRNAQLDYYSVLMKYNVSAAELERVTGVPLKTPSTL